MDNGADAYPNDPTRWGDSDGDGYDDGLDDDCPAFFGTSSHDRKGCPDQDGDGYSDPDSGWTTANGADAFMTDSTQWNDTDGDGYGDNLVGSLPDACVSTYGESWQNGTYGCPDADQDGWSDDQDTHPGDQTQWADSDGDGYGDNPGGTQPDACPTVWGNSTQGNRLGCLDTDGDGWDDTIDALPNLETQWLDQDGDGYGDNATGIQPDACPGEAGTSTVPYGCVDDDGDGYANFTDDFPNDPTRWNDSDGDGYDDVEDACPLISGNSSQDRLGCLDSDGDGFSNPTPPVGNTSGWNVSNGADAFPDEPSQIVDSDGDGYGDNASGVQPDACPAEAGFSSVDRFGCTDEDGDGTSDANDAFLGEPSQWTDSDGDGYGDNPNGTQPDACVATVGTSTLDVYGCPDGDGDGAGDTNDLWPNDPTQWFDSDGDGYGDEVQGTDGDACPNDFERQRRAAPSDARMLTGTNGRTNKTPSLTSAVNTSTATATATATTPRWAPSNRIIGPTTPLVVQQKQPWRARPCHRCGLGRQRLVHLHLHRLNHDEFSLCGRGCMAGDIKHRR